MQFNDDDAEIINNCTWHCGSDYLVVGRPITESNNPVESLKSFLKEIN